MASSPASGSSIIEGGPLPRLSTEERAALKWVAVTHSMPRPADVTEEMNPDFVKEPPKFFHANTSPEHRYAWARGMTEMRAFQADASRSGVVARIVLGGTFGPTFKALPDGTTQENWYMSRIPGVLEEIVLSIQHGQPVFLVGVFGGVAKLVMDLIQGVDRPEATWDFQKGAPHAEDMRKLYEAQGQPWMD